MPGTLYGVGVGPGDPELITLKGLKLIQRSPVVAFPAGLGDQPGIAQRIIADWLTPAQTQLPLTFPYVRDEAVLTQAWDAAADRVGAILNAGQDVTFVSEGDISFYSTFTYLAQTLQHHHPNLVVQTVPGICSPMAAASVLGIPLTVQAQRLTVLPALYTVADLETALTHADIVVLMKVSSVYAQVWPVLQQRGLLSASYVVERATMPGQTIYADLSDRPQLTLHYFSILIVQTQPRMIESKGLVNPAGV